MEERIVLRIEGPWHGCACGKRATTFYRGGKWCDDCYPGWEAVKDRQIPSALREGQEGKEPESENPHG